MKGDECVMDDNETIIYKSKETSNKSDDIHSVKFNEDTKEIHVVLNGALDDDKVQKAIFNRRMKLRNKGKTVIQHFDNKTYVDGKRFKRLKNGGHYVFDSETEYGDRPGDGVLTKKEKKRVTKHYDSKLNKQRKGSMMKKSNRPHVKRSLHSIERMEKLNGYKVSNHRKRVSKSNQTKPGLLSRIFHYLNPLTYIMKVVDYVNEKFASKKTRKSLHSVKDKVITALKVTILLPVIFVIKLVQRRFVSIGKEAKTV